MTRRAKLGSVVLLGAAGAALLGCSLLPVVAEGPPDPPQVVAAETLPLYDAMFQRTEGWTGADGAYSVPLGDGRILWLFSDTWVGRIGDKGHAGSAMINNSIAVQKRAEPNANLEFHYRTAAGKPESMFLPAGRKGFLWLVSGAMTEKGLYVFASQMEKTDGGGVFNFTQRGMVLLHVEKPAGDPLDWNVTQSALPFGKYAKGGNTVFGSAVVVEGKFAYVYGFREDWSRGLGGRSVVVARAPVGALGDFAQWRFYDGNAWTEKWDQATELFDGGATEYSVSFLPGLKKFVAVYTEVGFSPKVLARTSRTPWGPWSRPVTLFEAPEVQWHKTYFCYAGKAHPELAKRADELVITYVANATDFAQLVKDTRIYRPRFARVRLAE
jgi:hypothetical protein